MTDSKEQISYVAIYRAECPCCDTRFAFFRDDTKPWPTPKLDSNGCEVRTVECPWCAATLEIWSDDIYKVERTHSVCNDGMWKVVGTEPASRNEYIKYLREDTL